MNFVFFIIIGLEEWGGQCRIGRRQSPIDLAKDAAVMGRYPSLYFRNYESSFVNAKIRNTGHSRKFAQTHLRHFISNLKSKLLQNLYSLYFHNGNDIKIVSHKNGFDH